MSKKILVIEDDPIATRLMEYILKKRGYQVLAASNGLEGLQMAQAEAPDLVILNVMLPGIDGLEVCRRLRAEKQARQPLVLMLSGKAQRADITNGLNMGADDYLTKPAAPSQIAGRVESLLSKQSLANSRMIVFVGSKDKVGTTTTVVNVAVALSQMGKQVVAVDLCPYEGSIAEHLGIKSQGGIRRLVKAPPDAPGHHFLAPALTVHESGIGVLSIRQPFGELEETPDTIVLPLDKLKESTDYFLVDLPFQPTAVTRSLLSRCDLAVIVSDYTTEALTGVKSAITVLRFLGIPQKRIGAVVTDPVGTFSQEDFTKIKSYIEPNIGVSLWGMIPYETGAAAGASYGSSNIMLSGRDCPMVSCIKDLAQRIIAAKMTKNEASP